MENIENMYYRDNKEGLDRKYKLQNIKDITEKYETCDFIQFLEERKLVYQGFKLKEKVGDDEIENNSGYRVYSGNQKQDYEILNTNNKIKGDNYIVEYKEYLEWFLIKDKETEIKEKRKLKRILNKTLNYTKKGLE